MYLHRALARLYEAIYIFLCLYEIHIFELRNLHLFLNSAVQIYEFHIFIISSSSFPGILQTNLMTSSQLAC